MRELLVLSLLAGCAAKPPALAAYPRTEAFDALASGQLDGARHRHDLLAITAFYEDDRIALEYQVTMDGRESDVRHVYDWAHQGSRSKLLSEAEMTRLSAALVRLPSASMSPPIERLVIISFRDGTSWVTRTYDRRALPAPMREIYDVIGERAETKGTRWR